MKCFMYSKDQHGPHTSRLRAGLEAIQTHGMALVPENHGNMVKKNKGKHRKSQKTCHGLSMVYYCLYVYIVVFPMNILPKTG